MTHELQPNMQATKPTSPSLHLGMAQPHVCATYDYIALHTGIGTKLNPMRYRNCGDASINSSLALRDMRGHYKCQDLLSYVHIPSY